MTAAEERGSVPVLLGCLVWCSCPPTSSASRRRRPAAGPARPRGGTPRNPRTQGARRTQARRVPRTLRGEPPTFTRRSRGLGRTGSPSAAGSRGPGWGACAGASGKPRKSARARGHARAGAAGARRARWHGVRYVRRGRDADGTVRVRYAPPPPTRANALVRAPAPPRRPLARSARGHGGGLTPRRPAPGPSGLAP